MCPVPQEHRTCIKRGHGTISVAGKTHGHTNSHTYHIVHCGHKKNTWPEQQSNVRDVCAYRAFAGHDTRQHRRQKRRDAPPSHCQHSHMHYTNTHTLSPIAKHISKEVLSQNTNAARAMAEMPLLFDSRNVLCRSAQLSSHPGNQTHTHTKCKEWAESGK